MRWPKPSESLAMKVTIGQNRSSKSRVPGFYIYSGDRLVMPYCLIGQQRHGAVPGLHSNKASSLVGVAHVNWLGSPAEVDLTVTLPSPSPPPPPFTFPMR